MAKPIFYNHNAKYKNSIDLLDKLVSIYSIIKKSKKDQILEFEKQILIYYILNGFSKDTKDIIKKELDKNINTINTTNSNLRRKGFLIKDTKNFTNNTVCKELQDIADSYISNPNKFYTIKFDKK